MRQDPRNAEELATAAGRRLGGSPVGNTPRTGTCQEQGTALMLACVQARILGRTADMKQIAVFLVALYSRQRFGAARRLAKVWVETLAAAGTRARW